MSPVCRLILKPWQVFLTAMTFCYSPVTLLQLRFQRYRSLVLSRVTVIVLAAKVSETQYVKFQICPSGKCWWIRCWSRFWASTRTSTTTRTTKVGSVDSATEATFIIVWRKVIISQGLTYPRVCAYSRGMIWCSSALTPGRYDYPGLLRKCWYKLRVPVGEID